MAIRLRFFAGLKDELGMSEMMMGDSPRTCEAALSFLGQRFPEASSLLSQCRFAVNGEWAAPGTSLQDGDELALLPPVSGG